MERITDKEFANFLETYPLYTKIKVGENLTSSDSILSNDYFTGKPFKFLCPYEQEIQTFKTDHISGMSTIFFPSPEKSDPDKLPYTFNKKTNKLDLTTHLRCICQSCEHEISFSLHLISDKSWNERKSGITIYMDKIGQYPPYNIGLPKILEKYLSKEDQSNYKKALVCLSTSYGIGAYSYLRRVIENEIKRIIKDISELTFDGSEKVKDAYIKFQEDHHMAKIINVINMHLPSSLKEIGDNPIRLLYEQLSGGIHEFTDEQCMEKAQSIDIVLNYVIKKLNEEKYQLNDVKEAMKNLRN